MSPPREPSAPVPASFAHHLADLAGAAILPHFRTPLAVDNKAGDGAFDPVTAADRAAEEVIRAEIRRVYPGHGIVGEELEAVGADARLKWVVDPIDGTRAFIMGYPLWGTLIGLVEDGEPRLGLLDQPFTGERFWSEGGAAYLRVRDGAARRLATRACAGLNHAVLSTTHPDLFAAGSEAQGFARLKAAARMTRFGGDCYAYAMLAAGFVDIVAEAGLKPYDIVALIPIIESAGGRVTTWDGRPASAGGRILATGDARVHDEALALLASAG